MGADNWTKCPKCGKDFREDYEIGIVENYFEIDYRGSCGTSRNPGCGYKLKFEHSEKVQPKEEERKP